MKSHKSSVTALTWLCAAAYFCSYLTRLNYSAVMVEMVAQENFSEVGASVALTGLFITYGIGQIISGFLGDKVKPQSLVFCGLVLSAAMNLTITVCPNTTWLTIVWCINGFAQAMMWPPLVRIISTYMNEDEYKKATVRVTWGSSLGTIVVYLTAPLYIAISGWRAVFIASALMAILMALIWLPCYKKLERTIRRDRTETLPKESAESAQTAASISKLSGGIIGLLAIIIIGIIMQGLLRDGITTWMPSYINSNFNLGSSFAILTAVILPIFSIISISVVSMVNRKLIKNELTCSAFFFGIGTIALILLKVAQSDAALGSIILSVACLAIASACMHGVNLILICTVPKFFQYTGRISLISGVLNAFTYVGSALSTSGIAMIVENPDQSLNWSLAVWIWIGVAAVGTVVCVSAIYAWRNFKKKTGQQ